MRMNIKLLLTKSKNNLSKMHDTKSFGIYIWRESMIHIDPCIIRWFVGVEWILKNDKSLLHYVNCIGKLFT